MPQWSQSAIAAYAKCFHVHAECSQDSLHYLIMYVIGIDKTRSFKEEILLYFLNWVLFYIIFYTLYSIFFNKCDNQIS